MAYSDEFRLAVVVLLNGAVLAAAYRLARHRASGGLIQTICDTLLLYFLVQYASVALPGICGFFNAWTMSAVGLALAVGMWLAAAKYRPRTARFTWDFDRLMLLGCAMFTITYLAGYAYIERLIPPIATDSLVYHLPTAVQWIQTGKLGIYPTWFWNPAASYSPATGSTFMAWWMAPMGNDVLVRFVQLPPLILIFFLVARLAQLLGCSDAVAGLLAVAATLSRPLFSESMFQKDDLYVTAFIAASIVALGNQPLRDRLGPWRLGIAFGFVLASKYTALLTLPIFLFLVDAPFRTGWKWRQFAIAITTVLVLSAPWYLRNLVLTGNPLYPVDIHVGPLHIPGLFGTERDQQLRAIGGIWRMLSQTYHSLPLTLIVPLAVCWVWALWAGGRRLISEPLPRACVIGSVVTLAIFLATSPHHEVRYVFPLILVWFAAIAVPLATRLPLHLEIMVALLFAVASVVTSFSSMIVSLSAPLIGAGIAIGLLAIGLSLAFEKFGLTKQHLGIACSIVVLLLAMATYIDWHAYVQECREARFIAWARPDGYPKEAALWKFVDEQTPPDAVIAYSNSFWVYPYYGFEYTRHVGYAPTRRPLHDYLHFPRMGDRVPGDIIVQTMTRVQDTDPDLQTWLENLRRMHAQYLIVAKHAIDEDPPELKLAKSDPSRFSKIYEDDYGIVYRIAT